MTQSGAPGETPLPAAPLAGVRIVELLGGDTDAGARHLADLGADVVLVEPPGGATARRRGPMHLGQSLYFATRHANKRSICLDLHDPSDRHRLIAMLERTDVLLDTTRPGELHDAGLDPDQLRRRFPSLVVVSVSAFGHSGPLRRWTGTDAVLVAMSAVLARSGLPGRAPLLPPGSLALDAAAAHIAWTTLTAYANRLETGVGDHLDISLYEAVSQVFDPPLGMGGTAAGEAPAADASLGRPDNRHRYPIFRCADGHVRFAILGVRQWQSLYTWLGRPAEFASLAFDRIEGRYAARDRLYPAIAEFVATSARDHLVAEGQRRGVPIEGLRTPRELLEAEHFGLRDAIQEIEILDGIIARVPVGPVEIDGHRCGFVHRAPTLGDHDVDVEVQGDVPAPTHAASAGEGRRTRPFDGMRILDLGVIVMGAELGRLFADQGAEVIKIENHQYPDGARQAIPPGELMNRSFARGHRNKLSVGLDLRQAEGRRLFERLAAGSDVVMSNFKPGTLESLGLGVDHLRRLNPRLVVVESSAFGTGGPWSGHMGYGPLVRAATGVTGLWRDPDDEDGFSDASTIYPDHVSARIIAIACLALLIGRRRSGAGGHVGVAQAEVVLSQFAAELAAEWLQPGTLVAGWSSSGEVNRVYPCLGADEWCVVTIRYEQDWRRLCDVIGQPELADQIDVAALREPSIGRTRADSAVSEWTSRHTSRDVARRLQHERVPAGYMQRVEDVEGDSQLAALGFVGYIDHPYLDAPLPVERRLACSQSLADPPLHPAPLFGHHTRDVCERVLRLDRAEFDQLVSADVLQISEASEQ